MITISALLAFLKTQTNVEDKGSLYYGDYSLLKSSETSDDLSQSDWERFNRLKHLRKSILLETELEELYAKKPEIPRLTWLFFYQRKVNQLRRDWENHVDKSLTNLDKVSALGCNDYSLKMR